MFSSSYFVSFAEKSVVFVPLQVKANIDEMMEFLPPGKVANWLVSSDKPIFDTTWSGSAVAECFKKIENQKDPTFAPGIGNLKKD